MVEIRFERYNEGLIKLLEDKGLMLIEDDFDKKIMYTIYCDEETFGKLLPFIDEPSVKNVDDTGWEDKWKEYLKAGNLTDKIRYVFEKEDFVHGRDILINPALAFGTGNHPTTQLAATLLEDVCSGKSVLDVGCGSGILSIAAKISGASQVYAFDNDSVAIKNTKENLILNKSEDILIWAGTTQSIKSGVYFDVVVANIISGVLLSLKNDFFSLKPEFLIFSGILEVEQEDFLNGFENELYVIDRILKKNEWIGIRYRRRDV